jgi:amino acid permease
MNKKLITTAFTLSGTMIGAGILGLPYVFAKSGFLIGVFWLLFLGLIIAYVNLCLGEVCLRTKTRHQLAGYARKYLGDFWSKVMFFAFAFGIYSALIAYLIGEGQSFARLFNFDLNYAIYFGFGFWLLMTLFLREGLRGLRKIEVYGIIGIIFLIFLISLIFLSNIQYNNLSYVDYNSWFFPFGVVFFSLLGFSVIPELRVLIKNQEKDLKKAIILGTFIPIFLYLLFSFVGIGVFGKSIQEVATLSFGRLATLLGIFTMMAAYFSLSFSLKDSYIFDFHYSNFTCFILVSVLPLFFYLLFSYFNFLSFVKILGIGGSISGGLTGILILLMFYKSKKNGDRKSEYKIPYFLILNIFLILLFILGIVLELFL